MAKGNILKEAIADAKAVREVALENAKAALEEAFTPKLQNMLSAKLAEDLDLEDDQDLELGETEEMSFEDKMYDEDYGEEDSMDEEIDLEEILNELELEEGKKADDEEVVAEGDDEEEEIDEAHRPVFKADETQLVNPKPEYVHGINEDEEFDLDSLLKEINNLDENRGVGAHSPRPTTGRFKKPSKSGRTHRSGRSIAKKRHVSPARAMFRENDSCKESKEEVNNLKKELNEIKKVLNVKTGELNEVNLLNSKLLYVNRIFKANNLDDSQKLRVVETLDKADSTKEAKLIYETIKDTFKVANDKKVPKKQAKTIKENFRGMASKAAGTSRTKKTAPKRAIISESDNLVNRFQKLANINISE